MHEIKVHQDCVKSFNDLKLGKKTAFIIFDFDQNDKQIIPKCSAEKDPHEVNGAYREFLAALPKNNVCYGVVKIDFETAENLKKTEMVFITWAPEAAPVKRRMLMASSSDAIKKSLPGIKKYLQATCYDDLELSVLIERAKGN